MSDLDTYDLTDLQAALVIRAYPYPTILQSRVEKACATYLERKGWGGVENGASGERIFRLNQDGETAAGTGVF